jgi:glucose/arabinose dehydrogenase
VKFVQGKRVAGVALDLAVNNRSERGLLGIAMSPTFTRDHFVYLYYTASSTGGDSGESADVISNSVKRYRWDGATLTFSKRILDLPATPGPNHDGGKLVFGPDRKLYVAVGELNRNERTSNHSQPDTINRIGSILRVKATGATATDNPFYDARNTGDSKRRALNDIYAYGVRNTFGMAFDPVSRTLWESENGPERFDEINRITPGFNGGWEATTGPASRNPSFSAGADLISFSSRSHYEDPKFSWATPVAPTAMQFMTSTRLGKQYKDELFVGDVHGGKLFHFDLTHTRRSLSLKGALADRVADNSADHLFAEQSPIVLGDGFGTITDLVNGPGGMFAVSYTSGAVYRVTTAPLGGATPVPEPQIGLLLISVGILSRRNHR